MKSPSNLLIKLSKTLFKDTNEQERFMDALINSQPFNPCILWLNPQPIPHPFSVETPLEWQPEFVDRLRLDQRPGKHILHEQGHFYCLDFSSIFAASPLLNLSNPLSFAVDVCASPGGKSIWVWRTLKPDLIMTNETVKKRVKILISNLKRCQVYPSIVTNLEVEYLGNFLDKTADLVLVDAPCSGQSLLAKGEKNPGCFHPVTINNNANRQKRILANSANIVAPQGYLIYMTCTYSLAENEGVSQWFMDKFPHFQPLEIPFLENYRSPLAPFPCYRMWPQDRLGAGAYTILWQNRQGGEKKTLPPEWLEAYYLQQKDGYFQRDEVPNPIREDHETETS